MITTNMVNEVLEHKKAVIVEQAELLVEAIELLTDPVRGGRRWEVELDTFLDKVNKHEKKLDALLAVAEASKGVK